jgi:murein DD-endopeptidase MepM/ murein hydrolase activator NlpD
VFASHPASANAETATRDLSSFEVWELSLECSRRRRALAAQRRKRAPRTKATAAAASATLLVSPLLALIPAGAAAAPDGGTQAASLLSGIGLVIASRGDVGEVVAAVQRTVGVVADGVFGPITQRAVANFQARAGLKRTGDVDGRTWRAMLRSAAAAAQPSAPAPAVDGACGATIATPVDGPVTSGFGDGRRHAGIDLSAPIGTPVAAVACGTVTQAGTQGGYGSIVCIEHSATFSSCYAHLSQIAVQPGRYVARGEVVGKVGRSGRSTGPHLHFEIRVSGRAQDPAPYLSGARAIPGPVAGAARTKSARTNSAARTKGKARSNQSGGARAFG